MTSHPSNSAPAAATSRIPPIAWAALVCLAYLAMEIYLLGRLGLPLDDSWIHLQFAHRVAEGAGLTYNPGQWMAGSSSPLWTALLAAARLLPGNEILWAKLLGVVFFLLTVDAGRRFAEALGLGVWLSRLAAVLIALTPWLVWAAISGMEVTLFSWLSLEGLVQHLRERQRSGDSELADGDGVPRSLALFGLAALARPEGLLLLVLAILDRVLVFERVEDGLRIDRARRRRDFGAVLEGAALAALMVGAVLVVFRLESGSFLPTTLAVKGSAAGDGGHDLLPSGRYLRVVLDILFRSQPILTLLAGAGILRLVEDFGGPRDRGLLPALWPVGLAMAYAVAATPGGAVVVGNFGRYFFPLLPVVVVLGVLGVERLVHTWRSPRLALLGAMLLLWPQVSMLKSGVLVSAQTVANVEDSDVAAALWLADQGLPPDALIATQDIGAMKYLLPNPVLDLAGIVNPEILSVLRPEPPDAPGEAGPSWEERLYEFLEERRPDLLVVFPGSYPNLVRQPGFQPIRRFEIPDNMTMAGDELVIFRTPWTRLTLPVAP